MSDTSYVKEDENGPKSRETILGLGYSKNTVRIFNKISHLLEKMETSMYYYKPPSLMISSSTVVAISSVLSRSFGSADVHTHLVMYFF